MIQLLNSSCYAGVSYSKKKISSVMVSVILVLFLAQMLINKSINVDDSLVKGCL